MNEQLFLAISILCEQVEQLTTAFSGCLIPVLLDRHSHYWCHNFPFDGDEFHKPIHGTLDLVPRDLDDHIHYLLHPIPKHFLIVECIEKTAYMKIGFRHTERGM